MTISPFARRATSRHLPAKSLDGYSTTNKPDAADERQPVVTRNRASTSVEVVCGGCQWQFGPRDVPVQAGSRKYHSECLVR